MATIGNVKRISSRRGKKNPPNPFLKNLLLYGGELNEWNSPGKITGKSDWGNLTGIRSGLTKAFKKLIVRKKPRHDL